MPRACWPLVVACLIVPARAMGQEPPVVEPPASDPAATQPPVAEQLPPPPVDPVARSAEPAALTEITVGKATQVRAGLGFSGPLGAGLSLRLMHGLGADVRDGEGRVKAVCAVPISHCAQGFTLQAEAGTGGGKLSLGIGARAHVNDEDFRGTVGVGLRLSAARTWGSPIGTEPDLTYLGPELDLGILRVNLTLGVLWRISGQGGASALFSWGVGFGL